MKNKTNKTLTLILGITAVVAAIAGLIFYLRWQKQQTELATGDGGTTKLASSYLADANTTTDTPGSQTGTTNGTPITVDFLTTYQNAQTTQQ